MALTTEHSPRLEFKSTTGDGFKLFMDPKGPRRMLTLSLPGYKAKKIKSKPIVYGFLRLCLDQQNRMAIQTFTTDIEQQTNDLIQLIGLSGEIIKNYLKLFAPRKRNHPTQRKIQKPNEFITV